MADKVLVFSTHTSLDNRINKYLYTISKAGYQVIYNNSHDDTNCVEMANVEHKNLGQSFVKRNPIGALKALLGMRKTICANKDAFLVHIHDPLLLPLAKTANGLGMKVVYDRHESYDLVGGLSGRLSSFMERKFKKNLSGVVYVNNVQKKYLEDNQYPNVVSVPNYQSQEAYNSCRLNISPQKNKKFISIVYFGVINDLSRDCSLMLDAVDNVLEKHDNVTFIFGGNISGDKLKEKIDLLSKRHSNFHYLGVVKYDEVIMHTVSADIGMYLQKEGPNNIGSSPNKIYEYLMAGNAICAQGRFSDWDVIDGTAGVVLPYNSTCDQVVEALESIMSTKEKMAEYQEASLELSKRFTWESIEGNYLKLYRVLKEKAYE